MSKQIIARFEETKNKGSTDLDGLSMVTESYLNSRSCIKLHAIIKAGLTISKHSNELLFTTNLPNHDIQLKNEIKAIDKIWQKKIW